MREPDPSRSGGTAWLGPLRRPLNLLILALALLGILPIWTFKYFPSQDGPSHVENSYMLAHYLDQGAPYREYYDLNAKPFPNWLSHASLALAMKALPPLASEKMLLSAYVALFVLSMLYFLGSRCRYLVLLTLPFIYNCLLHSGFYNFVLSFPLVFVAVGYWWRRHRGPPGWKQAVGLNLLLALIYFSNILSAIVALLAVLILVGLHNRTTPRRGLVWAAAMTPSCALPLYYLLTSPSETAGRLGGERLLAYLARIGSLTSFDSREDLVGTALAAVFAALVVCRLYSLFGERLGLGRSAASGRAQDSAASGAAEDWACGQGQADDRWAFLVLAGCLCAVYLLTPRRAFGGGAITDRLSLFPWIAILPWIGGQAPRAVKYAAGGCAVALFLIHLGVTAHYYQVLNRGLDEYTSGSALVERGATILPVSFDHKGESARIGVYRHAVSYYCVARGAVNLANYEGDKSYFPLRYKPALNPFAAMGLVESQRGNLRPDRYPGRIDYVLLWSAPPDFPALAWIERNYDLIHTRGRLKLYRAR